MTGHRFDSVARLFAQRRTNRVSTLAATPTAATPIPMEPRPADAAAFLFVQSFQQGTLSPTGDGQFQLALSAGLGQTIFFSDRPDRVVGSLPTQQFLDALGFSMSNPPNAALVADRGDQTKEILIVELFAPVYDQANHALTYSVRILEDVEEVDMQLPHQLSSPPNSEEQYGETHLFIDDCKDGVILCYDDMLQENFLGCIPVHKCWLWSELDCFPCSTGNDFDAMAAMCKDAFGASACTDGKCSAGVSGECL